MPILSKNGILQSHRNQPQNSSWEKNSSKVSRFQTQKKDIVSIHLLTTPTPQLLLLGKGGPILCHGIARLRPVACGPSRISQNKQIDLTMKLRSQGLLQLTWNITQNGQPLWQRIILTWKIWLSTLNFKGISCLNICQKIVLKDIWKTSSKGEIQTFLKVAKNKWIFQILVKGGR